MSFHEERVMPRTDHHEEEDYSRETPAHCTECDGRVVYDEQHGDILCSECRLVIGECSAEQPQDIESNEFVEQRAITHNPEVITKVIDRERPTIISGVIQAQTEPNYAFISDERQDDYAYGTNNFRQALRKNAAWVSLSLKSTGCALRWVFQKIPAMSQARSFGRHTMRNFWSAIRLRESPPRQCVQQPAG